MHFFTNKLLSLVEEDYKIFSKKLIPDTDKEIIGVRTPLIKSLIKEYKHNKELFFDFLTQKHTFHEEFLLHGLILSTEKDINVLLEKLNVFSTQIDNWAVCDSTVAGLKLIKKYPTQTLELVKKFVKSNKPYVVRLGIVILLYYFLDKNFNREILEIVASVNSNNYYVNMAIAWFYSVALVKQYNFTIPIIQNKTLPKFVQNKTIQKAIESFRIPKETKSYLKTLKV